ncbi:MAG: signal peptidase I [Patescibacteria group bacterium]|jgi:signal peptidase
MKRKIASIIYCLVFLGLTAVAISSIFSVFRLPREIRLFAVQTGSMEPAIKTGSLIVVRPADQYQPGDIITFKTSPEANIKNPKALVTHRIVEEREVKGETFYVTKGDANESVDMENWPQTSVLGKVIYTLPYLGHPAAYAKTPIGFLCLVVIPASLIIYIELSKVFKQLAAFNNRRKKQKFEKEEIKILRIKLP